MSNSPGDFMGAAPAPKSGAAAGPKRLLLLAFTIVCGVVFGLAAGVSFAAWAGGLIGAVGGLVMGLSLTWILPLVLAVRANLALKRQQRPILLRRVVALFLVGVTQLTFFLVGVDNAGDEKVSTSAAIAQAALPLLGPVPVLGGLLDTHAKKGGAAGRDTTTTSPTGTTRTTTTGPDAGPADPTNTTTSTTTTTPSGLSPRTAGRSIGTVAAAATTADGGLLALRVGVAFGGQTSVDVIDLGAVADKGTPTRVESSADGHIVVVLAGQHVVVAAPGKAPALDAALGRGGKVGELDVQSVRDVAIGPGGPILLAVDAFDAKKNAVVQALIARPVGGAPFIVRRAGTTVEGEKLVAGEVADTTSGYSIKRHDGQGHVVVEEVFIEDDTDVGTKLDGAKYTMNPRRLLVGTVDSPRALTELVRTGDQPSGIESVTLQGFADAVALPDGRVFFDANSVEEGPRGWLFSARLGGGAFAVAPELVGKPEAPFAERAPRTPHLTIEPEGGFGFVTRDGALMLGSVQRLGESKPVLLRADAVSANGRIGGVSRVNAARLLPGAEWVLANVELLDDAGQRREALVLASRADLAAGKAEVLAVEGSAAPTAPATAPTTTAPTTTAPTTTAPTTTAPTTTAPTTPARLKTLFVLEGHEEPLQGLTP
jgi:hypothetical protein